MCWAISDHKRNTFFVSQDCHPQTIAVIQTRATTLGIKLVVGDAKGFESPGMPMQELCGVLVQYPTTDGRIIDYTDLVKHVHDAGALVIFAADLLALTLIKAPGEFGADIAVGRPSASACRWGTAARTRRSCRAKPSMSAKCRAESSASPKTPTEILRID